MKSKLQFVGLALCGAVLIMGIEMAAPGKRDRAALLPQARLKASR